MPREIYYRNRLRNWCQSLKTLKIFTSKAWAKMIHKVFLVQSVCWCFIDRFMSYKHIAKHHTPHEIIFNLMNSVIVNAHHSRAFYDFHPTHFPRFYCDVYADTYRKRTPWSEEIILVIALQKGSMWCSLSREYITSERFFYIHSRHHSIDWNSPAR